MARPQDTGIPLALCVRKIRSSPTAALSVGQPTVLLQGQPPACTTLVVLSLCLWAVRTRWRGVRRQNFSYVPLYNDDGTQAAPSYTFAASTGTGIYMPAVNNMAFVALNRTLVTINLSSSRPQLAVNSSDMGNGAAGGAVLIGQNTNATNNGAAFLQMATRGGTAYRFWVSNANIFRFNTADPTTANDNAGTAIITFASSRAVKDILGDPDAPLTVMDHLRVGAASVKRFAYKALSLDGERPFGSDNFSGIIIDDAPRYAMDNMKALNMFTAIGDLMIGTNHLHDRIIDLESEVATLKQQLAELQGA